MRIVFYSASTSAHSNSSTKTTYQPFRADTWDEMDRLYADCEFVVAGPLNGSYIFDVADGEICKKPEKVKYVLLESGMIAEGTAELIAQQKPDIAVAIASGAVPFDWVPIKTALIAEELQKRGIATIANNTLVSVAAFDKWRSNIMFRSFVKAAKGIYIHHELFLAEKKNPGVSVNVYKEYVFYRIKEMNFPVIVKDTLGAGSIGVEVMNSYEEVESFLNSDRNNSDIMVEELIQGEQFGTEIHGVEGRYSVLPPIAFSVTKEGITDPLSSVKFGPVTDPSYHFEKVQEELLNMAQSLKFEGTVQVDLVYRAGEWYIIEINPRWSGMTTTTAAMEGRNPLSIFVDSILGTDKNYSMKRNLKYALNFKMKARSQEDLIRLYGNPHVDYIMQLETSVAGMEKINYCEVVISTDQEKEDILNILNELEEEFPGLVSDNVKANAGELVAKYQ